MSGIAKLDDGVPPGGNNVYIWNITDNFAPTEDDDACIPWGYHSHVDSMMDIETGLVGVLVTCKKGKFRLDTYSNGKYKCKQTKQIQKGQLLMIVYNYNILIKINNYISFFFLKQM